MKVAGCHSPLCGSHSHIVPQKPHLWHTPTSLSYHHLQCATINSMSPATDAVIPSLLRNSLRWGHIVKICSGSQTIPHISLSTIDCLPHLSQLFEHKQPQTTNYHIILIFPHCQHIPSSLDPPRCLGNSLDPSDKSYRLLRRSDKIVISNSLWSSNLSRSPPTLVKLYHTPLFTLWIVFNLVQNVSEQQEPLCSAFHLVSLFSLSITPCLILLVLTYFKYLSILYLAL
jgi:hypothetical protein